MAILGYNVDSFLIPIESLNEFEFAKSLFKIREHYSKSKMISDKINIIIDNYNLTKKEIRAILESKEEYNEEFIKKINRSIKANKNDNTNALARKLAKHCKRESTENLDKQKAVKKEHIYNLLLNSELEELCKNVPRIVIFLDNVKAHKTDLVLDIAESLNIYLLPLPEYSPDLAPVELVFSILKESIKSNKLTTKHEIIEQCMNTFETKCRSYSIFGWFIEEYVPIIC